MFIVLAQCFFFLSTRKGSFYTPLVSWARCAAVLIAQSFVVQPSWFAITQQGVVLSVYLILAVALHVYMMKVVRVANEPSIKVALQVSQANSDHVC